jgi:hypothetical protein
VDLAVEAARKALTRNKGRDWARAPSAVRAKYLRAIAAKVLFSRAPFPCLVFTSLSIFLSLDGIIGFIFTGTVSVF